LSLWPDAITPSLWPYAVQKASDDMNRVPNIGSDKTPYELFTGQDDPPSLINKHSFGCPMYILNKDAQARRKLSRWEMRARLPIYIGPSIYHASSIRSGLSLSMGLVSPTFHQHYDDRFTTVYPRYVQYVPRSQWQNKCGFKKEMADVIVESMPKVTEGDIVESIPER
jgi:hypothetical protein